MPQPPRPTRSRRLATLVAAVAAILAALASTAAQVPAALDRELRRIFQDREYAAKTFGPAVWFPDDASYGVLEQDGSGASVLVAYDAATGAREILADAALLTPKGAASPLAIDDYAWTPDRRLALIFTNTQRVWRQNTRGDYWLLDRQAR